MSTAVKNLNVRTKRGKLIAEMGLVSRDEQGFHIKSPSRNRESYRVWRDERGRVCCSCVEFEQEEHEDPRFRCEHILAVKYYLEETAPAPAENSANSTTEQINPITTEVDDMPFSTPVAPAPKTASTTMTTAQKVQRAMVTAHAEDELPEMAFQPEADPTMSVIAETDKEPFSQVLKRLSQPIPKEHVRQRVGWTDKSGHEHEIDYIEWHTVADLLDQIYPKWSHAVKDIRQIGDLVAVTASITIQGVTREGVGTGAAYDEKGIKKAEHDALKRAAVKFGIARELYKKDEETADGGQLPLLKFPRNPVAKDISEMATPKQHAAIRAIANAQGVDAEAECSELLNCKLAELSRRAASAFIDHLKSKQTLSA